MKVLSLFDGMACGALALLSAGVEIESYDAFEIDKYAVKTSSHNFPFITHHGDVFEADFTKFEGVDLVCGGSPCTYWSIAQKNNRETEASGLGWELFSQYVRAVKEAKPKFFIYENNKSMSKAIRQSIDETFGFEAVLINSALVSAQNRQRLYWVGRRNEDGTYSKVNVEQPEDRGIVLRDILETGVNLTSNEKSYALTTRCNGAIPEDTISRRRHTMVAEPINTTDDEKAQVLKANYYKSSVANFFNGNDGMKYAATGVAEPVRIPEYGVDDKSRPVITAYSKRGTCENQILSNCFPDNPSKQLSDYVAEPVRIPPYGAEDKARPLNALYPNNCGGFEHRMFSEKPNKQQVDMVAEPIDIDRCHHLEAKENYIQYDLSGKSHNSQDQRAYYEDSKHGTLNASSTQSKTGVIEPIRIGDIGSNSQAHRVYSCDGKSVTLSANGGGQGGKTGLYATPICHTIPQIVRVRKYTCDIDKFQTLLRESKKKSGLTNKDIAKKFNRPQTEVEHWFRTDKCFSVPDAEIWDKLKDFLNIETTEYDAFVTVFEEREGVFEKADRCYDVNGKMSTLMTTKSDNIIEPTTSKKERPIYEVKDGFITIKDKKYPIKLKDGYYIIRKLTVTECKRLQTVPDAYEFPVSDSQAYKMLGNGWTIEVISHLVKACLSDMGDIQPKNDQMRFF